MERILNFFDKVTNGKCYKLFKYSLDDVNVPALQYDDKPKIILEPKTETKKGLSVFLLKMKLRNIKVFVQQGYHLAGTQVLLGVPPSG
jgi:hypothetical protein